MRLKPLTALTTSSAMFALDVATMAWAWPLVLAVALAGTEVPGAADAAAMLLYPAANLLLLYALGLYRRDAIMEPRRAIGRIPVVACAGGLTVAAACATGLLLGRVHDPARLAAAAILGFMASELLARALFYSLRRRGLFRRRILVLGAGKRAWDLAWMLCKEGSTLNYEITFVHDPALGDIDPRLADGSVGAVVQAAEFGILGAARRAGADQIVVAPDAGSVAALQDRGLSRAAVSQLRRDGNSPR